MGEDGEEGSIVSFLFFKIFGKSLIVIDTPSRVSPSSGRIHLFNMSINNATPITPYVKLIG